MPTKKRINDFFPMKFACVNPTATTAKRAKGKKKLKRRRLRECREENTVPAQSIQENMEIMLQPAAMIRASEAKNSNRRLLLLFLTKYKAAKTKANQKYPCQ